MSRNRFVPAEMTPCGELAQQAKLEKQRKRTGEDVIVNPA